VSDGGLVDKDNKGHIKTRGCNVWAKYDLDEFFSPEKTSEDFYVAHTGYYGVDVVADRNRMVPYDILVEMEQGGQINSLHRTYYVTTGNSTVAKWCARMGDEIVAELKRDQVDGVILTST
jgi:glycine/betaine/sarcosine/D-proline reductase family selenoprotein B